MTKIPSIDVERTKNLISTFIKQRMDNTKTNGVIIGISGGIDSAVAAYLAVSAVGPKKVYLFFLPDHVTSIEDREDVKALSKKLEVPLREIPIDRILTTFQEVLQEETQEREIHWANLKPRIRQNILYFYANKLNCLVVGTGNKSEAMIGYFTKYGDGACDIAPLIDLYKGHIVALAKSLGIPQKIIEKRPSAGLWEGQTDEEEIGMSYDDLDLILSTLERFKTVDSAIEKTRVKPSKVEKVQKMIEKSEHKRQGPLRLKLAYRSPGMDWRNPLGEQN